MNNNDVYLVTGAAGFVGSHMVRLLLDNGVKVRAMVRSIEKATQLKGLDVEFVEADMQDADSLKKAVKGVKGIYHIASIFRQNGEDALFRDINAEGTRRLFDAAIEAGVSRIIHCSTVGVHGHIKNPPATEETEYAPGDIYQQTKMEGELIALDYFKNGRMNGVVIRPAMIYGPEDKRTLKLFRMIAKGRFFYVGKGLATVHWIDVRDLANAFYLAMQHTERNAEVYIISGESARPLKDMAEMVAQYLNVKPPKLHLPVKPMQWAGTLCETICIPLGIEPPLFRRRVDFFTKSRAFDNQKARDQLGFKPARNFKDELENILSWYKEAGWLS